MSSTLTNLTAATTWSGTDLFYMLVGGNSRKIAASSLLVTEAANVLSDVNSTNAQTFRVYRTFTDSSNYERLAISSGAAWFSLTVETAGTGTDDMNLNLIPAGVGQVLATSFRAYTGDTATKGIGYSSGAGGSVGQLTSKATGVTVNRLCGQITTDGAALSAGASVKFTVTCSPVQSADTVIVNHQSSGTLGSYRIEALSIVDGSFDVMITNVSGGSLSQAFVINYTIIKSVAS